MQFEIRNKQSHGQPATSPFDNIRRERPDGSEYWTAREMMGPLGYRKDKWQNMESVVERAKISCNAMGHNVLDHFTGVSKVIETGRWGGTTVSDVELTRYACSLVAMNGDPRKPEVAAAQQYFAVMTRAAELAASVNSRPWSERLRVTALPHVRYVNIHHPGCFTVVTTFTTSILGLEDELARHLFELRPSDRPDGSIGQCWAHERRRLGMARVTKSAPLYLPDSGYEVNLCVYDNDERGACEHWFHRVYVPTKMAIYLANKREFKEYGELAAASVAENACLSLTGSSARIKPKLRKQIVAAGGFCPAGYSPPQLPSPQRLLFA